MTAITLNDRDDRSLKFTLSVQILTELSKLLKYTYNSEVSVELMYFIMHWADGSG